MSLFAYSPELGLWGLGLYSLVSATLLPGGSEVALAAFLHAEPQELAPALAVATLGNTAGGMITWLCGRLLPQMSRLKALTQRERVERWGSPVLLLSWVPIIGDPLCLAAGWLRLAWLPCLCCMALGKFARYWLVAQALT